MTSFLEETYNLPDSDVIARDIVEDLEYRPTLIPTIRLPEVLFVQQSK